MKRQRNTLLYLRMINVCCFSAGRTMFWEDSSGGNVIWDGLVIGDVRVELERPSRRLSELLDWVIGEGGDQS